MFIPFGAQDYVPGRLNQPDIALRNMYAEEAPHLPHREFQLVPTPGLVARNTGFAGEAGACFRTAGLFGGDMWIAAGTTLYRRTALGAVTAAVTGLPAFTYKPQFASSQSEIGLVQGGNAYKVEGSSATQITVGAASGNIHGIAQEGQRFLFLEEGSGRVWFSDPGDIATVGGTSFVTTESESDPNLAIRVFKKDIILFGSDTTEIGYFTGSDQVPFRFRDSRMSVGILGYRAHTQTDNDVYFVSDTGRVMRYQYGNPVPVDTIPVVNHLEDVATADLDRVRLDTYQQGRRAFIILTIPGVGQFVMDEATGLWHERKRTGQTHGGIGPICQIDTAVFCLEEGGTTPDLYQLDREVYTDDGNTIIREATAAFPIVDANLNIQALRVEGFGGVGLDGNVQGSEPVLDLFVSRDGQSYGNAIRRSMGKIGQFRHAIVYGPLGNFKPGVPLFKIQYADPVGYTVTGVILNPRERR